MDELVRKIGLTRVEERMFRVLKDRKNHTPEQLHACLNDTLSPLKNISTHIMNLRRKLRTIGADVAHIRLGKQSFYRYFAAPKEKPPNEELSKPD